MVTDEQFKTLSNVAVKIGEVVRTKADKTTLANLATTLQADIQALKDDISKLDVRISVIEEALSNV